MCSAIMSNMRRAEREMRLFSGLAKLLLVQPYPGLFSRTLPCSAKYLGAANILDILLSMRLARDKAVSAGMRLAHPRPILASWF
jgi:hypothetical protein